MKRVSSGALWSLMLAGCSWATMHSSDGALPASMPDKVRVILISDSTFVVRHPELHADSLTGDWRYLDEGLLEREKGAPATRTVAATQIREVQRYRVTTVGIFLTAAGAVAGWFIGRSLAGD